MNSVFTKRRTLSQILHVGLTLYWLKTAFLLCRIYMAVSRRHFISALLLSYTLSLTVAHTGCTCPTLTLFRLMYLRVFLFLISSLHVSSPLLLIAQSKVAFHLLFVVGFSKSSEGVGRLYRCITMRILLNQAASVGGFMASYCKHISFSIPSLVNHIQNRPSMFLYRTASTGGYRAKPMTQTSESYLEGVVIFSRISSVIAPIPVCLRSGTSSPYNTLCMTYVDQSFSLTFCFNHLHYENKPPSVNMRFSCLS